MNVYEYYLSTCKYVLFANPSDKSTWIDLYSYLPCLRQMMSCCVCGNIMLKPKGPGHGICSHHVCSSCIGGKMRLRPACSWCRTHQGFVDNPSMRLLILCFKKMCVFINNSAVGEQIRKSVTNGTRVNTLIRVLDEAIAFEDDYVITNNVMPTCVPTYGMAPEPKLISFPRRSQGQNPGHYSVRGRIGSDSTSSDSSHLVSDDPPPSLICVKSEPKNLDERHSSANDQSEEDFDKMPAILAPRVRVRDFTGLEKPSASLEGPHNGDSVDQEDKWMHVTRRGRYHSDRIQAPLKATSLHTNISRRGRKCGKALYTSKLYASRKTQLKSTGKYQKKKLFKPDADFEPPCKRTRLASSLNTRVQSSRKMCTCAYLNTPSRLTCSEGRCPCYSSQLPCVNCGCRGCRNPCRESATTSRNGDDMKADTDSDPAMPVLSPEPRL